MCVLMCDQYFFSFLSCHHMDNMDKFILCLCTHHTHVLLCNFCQLKQLSSIYSLLHTPQQIHNLLSHTNQDLGSPKWR